MATFFNQARLSYNGITTTSNTISGELVEVLTAAKTAVVENYTQGGRITYLITLVNAGTIGFNDLTVTDDLGAYPAGGTNVTPLTYTDGSIRYYQNGVLQAAPTVTAGPPLTVTGISVPAGGNVTLVYETTANEYAPLGTDGSIVNTMNAVGTGLAGTVSAAETVTPAPAANLQISKSVAPSTVTENGTLTFTFVISNTGNTEAGAEDNVVVSDTFDPILNPITVTLNGAPLAAGAGYQYNAATGEFSTVPGVLTVPAATFAQDPGTGVITATPGTTTLVVSGTV